MTRQEHLDWCKKRALEYVNAGDLQQAVASMLSDISKHDETQDKTGILGALGIHELTNGTPESIRRFIEGFN